MLRRVHIKVSRLLCQNREYIMKALHLIMMIALLCVSQACDDQEPRRLTGGQEQGGEAPGGGVTAGLSAGGQAGVSGGDSAGIIAGHTAGDTAGHSAGYSGGDSGGQGAGEPAGGLMAGVTGGSSGGGAQGGATQGGVEWTALDPCDPSPAVEAPLTEGLSDARGEAQVRVEGVGCERRFELESAAPRRDQLPESPRWLEERSGAPSLHSLSPMSDALYQLAIQEAEQCSVDSIRDGAFSEGEPLACPEGGCFETGKEWRYVWTRDTAYAVDLGLALLDPQRALNSLEFKLSERRGGGGLEIVQDTGSGGSYPISTDRAVWALGARAALATLSGPERQRFEAKAFEAMKNSAERDRVLVFDERVGLYRGEQSFLDWREQSYPEWVAEDVVHLGMSQALSTNVAHYALLSFTAELAERAGEAELRERFAGWATALKAAIQAELWLEEEGLFSTFIATSLDPAPSGRFDLLGNALAVLTGVANQSQAAQIMARYPLLPHGPAVQWPQLRDVPIYHNRGIWPFVTAYGMRAARRAENFSVVNLMMESLLKGAALNLSNMENLDAASGLAYAEDGGLSGPVVNSQRQLWSVAGSVALFHELLFGLRPTLDGLVVSPWVTEYARRDLLGGAERVSLTGLNWGGSSLEVFLEFPSDGLGLLPAEVGPESPLVWVAERVRLDGAPLDGPLPIDALSGSGPHQLLVTLRLNELPPNSGAHRLLDPADEEAYYAPRTPRLTALSRDAEGRVTLSIDTRGEEQLEGRVMSVYRDGVLLLDRGPLSATWRDEEAPLDQSLCYTVEISSSLSQNRSQRAQPQCVWTHIDSLYAGDFSALGGSRVDQYGRIHYQGWGAPEHQLSIEWVASRGGEALIQAEYGNGAGAINTGVTCALKRLDLVELPSGAVVGGGYLMMPHLGRWDRWSGSNLIPVTLTEGARYRLVVRQDQRSFNMSEFEHFERYTGGTGGAGGAFNDVNISALKVLHLE